MSHTFEGLLKSVTETRGSPCSATIDGWEFVLSVHPVLGAQMSARRIAEDADIVTLTAARRAIGIPASCSWRISPRGVYHWEWDVDDEHLPVVVDLKANVTAFHRAVDQYGQGKDARPEVPPRDIIKLRVSLLVEELLETVHGMVGTSEGLASGMAMFRQAIDEHFASGDVKTDLAAVADGLADLEYVAEGAFLAFGIDSAPVHTIVQASNMAKVGGPVREDGKRLKPPGWKPPDIAGEIDRQIKLSEGEWIACPSCVDEGWPVAQCEDKKFVRKSVM